MDELEEALKKKDEDMKQMEERYKKYLEKAKSVSIDLLPTTGELPFAECALTMLLAINLSQQDCVRNVIEFILPR